MKRTFEAKPPGASPKLNAHGQKAMTHTLARILSICILAVCSATLECYSQEATKPAAMTTTTATVGTLPAARTITDMKGRAMEGTILSKTETAITFERTTDRMKFEIQLDSLSDADKAFVAGLIDGPGKAAPGKKASVLYVISWSNPDDYEKDYKEQVTWLKARGFEVTIGLEYYSTTKLPQITDEKVTWLNPLALIDAYDIVWFPYFRHTRPSKVVSSKEYDYYQVANHRKNQGGITVFRVGEDRAKKETFLAYKPADTNGIAGNRRPENYVSNEGNWIFFWDTIDSSRREENARKAERKSTETTRIKLLQKIEELLSEKKK